jgi:hypothetical protein
MGTTIALAQLFSFIFSKMNEAGFIKKQGVRGACSISEPCVSAPVIPK